MGVWGSRIQPVIVAAIISFAVPLSAKTVFWIDFDNTIVETRESAEGTFDTKFRIYRIDMRANTLQKVATGPAVLEISSIDWYRLKKYFGHGNFRPGSQRKFTLTDGRKIIPGEYMMRNPESFDYFNEAVPGTNYVLQDFKSAEERDPSGKWKGPYWSYMTDILTDPEFAKTTRVISARGHSEKEWRELFEHFKSKGYIENLPDISRFASVARPEFEAFAPAGHIPEQKAAVAHEAAEQLARVPLRDDDVRLSADGKSVEKSHFLIFVDDNQGTIEHVTQLFRELASRKLGPIKYGVFNMGNATEIIDSKRPRFAIVEPDGTFRQATIFERYGEPKIGSPLYKKIVSLNPGCENMMAKLGESEEGDQQ